jgi:hypothetical protein
MSNPSGYTGPSVQEMTAKHTLAKEIIGRHGKGDEAILDDDNIAQLKRYLNQPELEKASLLAKLGTQDNDEAIIKLSDGGFTLVDYMVVTWGTPRAALTADEEGKLQEWFAAGGGAAQN